MAEVRAGQRCCRWYICCLLVRAVVQEGLIEKGITDAAERNLLQSVLSASISVCLVLRVVYHLICTKNS